MRNWPLFCFFMKYFISCAHGVALQCRSFGWSTALIQTEMSHQQLNGLPLKKKTYPRTCHMITFVSSLTYLI